MSSVLRTRAGRIVRSAAFRLTLFYAALFMASAGITVFLARHVFGA